MVCRFLCLENFNFLLYFVGWTWGKRKAIPVFSVFLLPENLRIACAHCSGLAETRVVLKNQHSGFLFFSGVLLGFIGLLGCILLCCILIVANTVLDLLMNVPRVALLFPIGCRHLGNICSLLSYFSQPFGSSGVIWKVFHVPYSQ